MKLNQLARSGCVWLFRGLGTLALWTFWLGLALLLALQIYVASTDQLEAPGFVVRAIERRLALSGIHATFGPTIFDPSGRVLLENVAMTLPGFEEPVVTARGIYVRLNPWALVLGRFEPAETWVTGADLRVPAMLSPTGQADAIIRDLDARFVPWGDQVSVEYLNFKLGGVGVSAHGEVNISARRRGAGAPLPLPEFLARDYATLSRKIDDAIESLAVLDHPVLRVELAPSESSGAIIALTLVARGLKLPGPIELRTTALQVAGQFPFVTTVGAPLSTELDFATDELDLPRGIVARGVHAQVHVRLPPGRLRFDRDVFHDIELSAADVTGGGLTVAAPLVTLSAGPLPRVRIGIRALLLDSPVSVRSEVDVKADTASVRFEGGFSPGLLDPLGEQIGRNLHRYVDLAQPVAIAGEARFGPGWKFQRTSARLAVEGATVWHVRLDEARARIEYDGHTLVAPELDLRLGDSFARGRYEQDVATQDYRLLLDGALRPPVIGPWFPAQSWWHEFFRPFGFPSSPPAAKVDVQSSWVNGRKALVFVAVDSRAPVFRGVPFDRLRTRLFIGPGFLNGLDFQVASGSRSASGGFSRRYDPVTGAWQSIDFDLASTFDLKPASAILGDKDGAFLAPFAFDRPPRVKVTGHFDGPAAPGGQHARVHIEAQSDGPFRFHDFPFSSVAFTADVHDDEILVDRIAAGFGGGTVAGSGRVWGRGAAQRVRFDAALQDARLGQTIAVVEGFSALRTHIPPPASTKFVQEKSTVRLDIAAAGEGLGDDFLSFQGGGKAVVEGTELGEVRMLGLFTELLPFASLRFTSARADFKINGSQLDFPDVDITGANSAIQAHGSYAMDTHQLDFKAKFFPFQKSKTLPQKLIGGMLAPLSEFLEVKLTGAIENPLWEFEHGPSNFFHNLAPPAPPAAKPAPPSVPPPPSSGANRVDKNGKIAI